MDQNKDSAKGSTAEKRVEDPYLEYLNSKFRFPRSLVHNPIHRFFTGFLEALSPGSQVLDAGCGNGVETGKFSDTHKVTGVDYQSEYVAYCQEKYPQGTYVEGHLSKLEIPDDSFDLVILNQVIEHLDEPHLVLSELSRVMRPQSSILVSTPNYDSMGWNLIENTYHRWFADEFEVEENHVTLYNPDMLRDHMGGTFSIEHLDTVSFGMILVAEGRNR